MMKKLHLILVFVLVATVAKAQDFPTSSWSDLADTSWYDSNESEFTLTTAEELAGVSQLVINGTTFEGKTLNIGADINLDGNLWTPIGDYPKLFAGDVEGNNHTISNLWVNTPEDDYGGLFGYVASTSFSNIKIDTANIIAFDSTGTLVGNLFNNGSVENCSAINISTTGNNNTGGLVGGLVQNSSITNSYAIGDVVGAVQVGGLAGSGWAIISITDSYSEGTVTADFLAGGLVGAFPFAFAGPSIINNTYSRSLVLATVERAGGLVGGADNQLIVKNSYSTGTVSAPSFEGATIGLWGSIQMENIYFDTESSGMTEAVGGFGGDPVTPDITAKTTAEMKDAEMVGLLNADNPNGPWSIDSSVNDGYPVLNFVLGVYNNTIDAASVKVYPTVFESEFTVSSTLELNSYQIYNIAGALISTGALDSNTATIKAANLSTGVYILTLRSAEGMISKRIIKK